MQQLKIGLSEVNESKHIFMLRQLLTEKKEFADKQRAKQEDRTSQKRQLIAVNVQLLTEMMEKPISCNGHMA